MALPNWADQSSKGPSFQPELHPDNDKDRPETPWDLQSPQALDSIAHPVAHCGPAAEHKHKSGTSM